MANTLQSKKKLGIAFQMILFFSTLIHMVPKTSGFPLFYFRNSIYNWNNLQAPQHFANKKILFIIFEINWFHSLKHSGKKKPIHAVGVFMGKNSENSDSSERDRKREK